MTGHKPFPAHPATKTLLVQARTNAELGPHVTGRSHDFACMTTADLTALGWEPAEPIAALLLATVAEIALHELTDGHHRDDLRNATLSLAVRRRHPPCG